MNKLLLPFSSMGLASHTLEWFYCKASTIYISQKIACVQHLISFATLPSPSLKHGADQNHLLLYAFAQPTIVAGIQDYRTNDSTSEPDKRA